MRSIAAALLCAALCAAAAAAPERPGNERSLALDRTPGAQSGESAAVAALLDSVDAELAASRPLKALALLERALRIEPRNAGLWHYLGIANLALGHYAQAEAMAAKSRSLAGGNRTLRTRNAELTAAALRAQGKPVPVAGREVAGLAARAERNPRLEPAATYVDRGDRYEPRSRASPRPARPFADSAPLLGLRRASPARQDREKTGTERVRRERAEPRVPQAGRRFVRRYGPNGFEL
jgi:tetratricopeptide (TPR) repeat protein